MIWNIDWIVSYGADTDANWGLLSDDFFLSYDLQFDNWAIPSSTWEIC